MKISRMVVLFGTLLSLVVYVLAIWGEMARKAEGLGFNERFGVGRLVAGFWEVSWEDLEGVRFGGWEYLVFAGMAAALLVSLAGVERISAWVVPIYLAVTLTLGGWVGMVMAIYLPWFLFCLVADPLPMDGEFFEDHVARGMAAGVWLAMVLCWCVVGFVQMRREWKSQHGRLGDV